MKRLIILLMVVSMVGAASATTVWNPAANNITPPDVGSFGDAANWTNGVPFIDGDDKAVFNVSGAAEAQVTDAFSGFQLVQGDGGEGGILRIMDGGTISTFGDNWSAIGWNDTALLIVEAGGTMNFGHHAWIGQNSGAVGTVDINGGTVTVAQMIGLGWNGGTGFININDGGLLSLANWHPDNSIQGASVLSINQGGVLEIAGNRVDQANNFFDNGFIASDLGAIEATFDADANMTTIVAIPGPATVALLGLGGLALLRKKK